MFTSSLGTHFLIVADVLLQMFLFNVVLIEVVFIATKRIDIARVAISEKHFPINFFNKIIPIANLGRSYSDSLVIVITYGIFWAFVLIPMIVLWLRGFDNATQIGDGGYLLSSIFWLGFVVFGYFQVCRTNYMMFILLSDKNNENIYI